MLTTINDISDIQDYLDTLTQKRDPGLLVPWEVRYGQNQRPTQLVSEGFSIDDQEASNKLNEILQSLSMFQSCKIVTSRQNTSIKRVCLSFKEIDDMVFCHLYMNNLMSSVYDVGDIIWQQGDDNDQIITYISRNDLERIYLIETCTELNDIQLNKQQLDGSTSILSFSRACLKQKIEMDKERCCHALSYFLNKISQGRMSDRHFYVNVKSMRSHYSDCFYCEVTDDFFDGLPGLTAKVADTNILALMLGQLPSCIDYHQYGYTNNEGNDYSENIPCGFKLRNIKDMPFIINTLSRNNLVEKVIEARRRFIDGIITFYPKSRDDESNSMLRFMPYDVQDEIFIKACPKEALLRTDQIREKLKEIRSSLDIR